MSNSADATIGVLAIITAVHPMVEAIMSKQPGESFFFGVAVLGFTCYTIAKICAALKERSG